MTSSNLRTITTIKGLCYTVALSLFMAAFVFAASSSSASQYAPSNAPVAQVTATVGDPSPPVDPVPSRTGVAQVSATVPVTGTAIPTAIATGTVAGTAIPTAIATGTVGGATAVATGTAEATGTVGGATAVATGTVAGSTAVATGTVAATSPTAEATMGADPTATTDMGGGMAEATPTTDMGGGTVGGVTGGTTPPGMPATGSGDNWLVLVLVALGALSLAAGLLVRAPQKK